MQLRGLLLGISGRSICCAILLSVAADARAETQSPEANERRKQTATARSDEAAKVASLRRLLLALSPGVSQREASRVAASAHATARALKREYAIVGPPQFHNFLVNTGIRKRGLCHQWTRDLMAQLSALKLNTLDLHWGIARAGTLREHNAVVVTARRQPFETGIVLDPWRHSGRLFVGRVAGDRYPWREDVGDCLCERSRAQKRRTARARVPTSSGASRAVAAAESPRH